MSQSALKKHSRSNSQKPPAANRKSKLGSWRNGGTRTEVSVGESAPIMTYAQFLKHDFENPHVEWVNGKVVSMPPISDEHMDLGGLLEAVLRAFAEEKKLGVIRHDPFQMKLGGDLPGRAPDVLFLKTAHKSRLKKLFVKGPADMVIEIISPTGRSRDRGEKFYEYEEGGVPEYWLIDPERKQAEFYLRNKRGIFELAKLDADGVFHSVAMPGVWVNPDWFWQNPLPTTISIMRLWGLI